MRSAVAMASRGRARDSVFFAAGEWDDFGRRPGLASDGRSDFSIRISFVLFRWCDPFRQLKLAQIAFTAPFACSPASTLSGESGSEVIRTPTASSTAFAIALAM